MLVEPSSSDLAGANSLRTVLIILKYEEKKEVEKKIWIRIRI